MKLAFFHLVACVVVGVVCDQEAEKPVELNTFEKFILWLDPEVHVGDECVVGISPILPDPFHWFAYEGERRIVGSCYDGIPVFGSSFHEDANARAHGYEYVKDGICCCLKVKCGPDNNGYCNAEGTGCKDFGAKPLASSNCPGVDSQCCPTLATTSSDASPGYNNDLLALGEDTVSGINPGQEIAFGTGTLDDDLLLGMDTPPQGSLNPNDWETEPLDNENLFLATDDTDDYGLVASLGGSLDEGLGDTA